MQKSQTEQIIRLADCGNWFVNDLSNTSENITEWLKEKRSNRKLES